MREKLRKNAKLVENKNRQKQIVKIGKKIVEKDKNRQRKGENRYKNFKKTAKMQQKKLANVE